MNIPVCRWASARSSTKRPHLGCATYMVGRHRTKNYALERLADPKRCVLSCLKPVYARFVVRHISLSQWWGSIQRERLPHVIIYGAAQPEWNPTIIGRQTRGKSPLLDRVVHRSPFKTFRADLFDAAADIWKSSSHAGNNSSDVQL